MRSFKLLRTFSTGSTKPRRSRNFALSLWLVWSCWITTITGTRVIECTCLITMTTLSARCSKLRWIGRSGPSQATSLDRKDEFLRPQIKLAGTPARGRIVVLVKEKHELQAIVQTPAELSHGRFHKRTKLQRRILFALFLELVESLVHYFRQ